MLRSSKSKLKSTPKSRSKSTSKPKSKSNPSPPRPNSKPKATSNGGGSSKRVSKQRARGTNVLAHLRDIESKAEDLRDAIETHIWGELNKSEKQHIRARLLFMTAVVACVLSVASFATDGEGASLIMPRVVRGDAVPRGSYLYAANLIRKPGGHICGGSLIREDFVLTAAHCVQDMVRSPWRYDVLVGNYNLRKPEEEEETFQVLDVVVHPGYNSRGTFDYDVALIRIHGKSQHKPVQLDDGSISFDSATSLTAVGWGRTEKLRLSSTPRKLDVKHFDSEKCKEIWALHRRVVTDSMLCGVPAKLSSWESGVFKGDSGGPLLAQKLDEKGDPAGSEVSVGVVSWSWPPFGMNGGFPQVYGRVASAYAWIHEEMNKPSPREEPVKVAAWAMFISDTPYYLLRAYMLGSKITALAVGFPFVMRYSGLERRIGLNFDETLESLRFTLLVAFFLAPYIIRTAVLFVLP